MRRHATSLALAAALAALPAGCGTGGQDAGSTLLDVTIGDLRLRAGSGAAVVGPASGEVTLYLSDQPDACLAVRLTPAGTATLLTVHAVAAAGGATTASVVAWTTAPAAGEATGRLRRAAAGVPQATLDAKDGAVSWALLPDGRVTIAALDLGFDGASQRLTAAGLTLAACP